MDTFVDALTEDKASIMSDEQKVELEKCIARKAKQLIRSQDFSAKNCAKLMDMNGADVCYSTWDIMRLLETRGAKWKRNCIIPSSAEVKRVHKNVERYGKTKVTLRHGFLDGLRGEYVEFEPDELLVLVIEAFGLTEIAKERPIRINLAIDGAQLSKRMTHVTMGFKINDPAALCPFTGRPLFMSHDNQIMQSRKLCFSEKW